MNGYLKCALSSDMVLVPRPVCLGFHFERVSMGIPLTASEASTEDLARLEVYKEGRLSEMGHYSFPQFLAVLLRLFSQFSFRSFFGPGWLLCFFTFDLRRSLYIRIFL